MKEATCRCGFRGDAGVLNHVGCFQCGSHPWEYEYDEVIGTPEDLYDDDSASYWESVL